MIEPLVWKRIARRRAVMWAESTRWSGLARGGLSNLVRRQLVRHVDAFVSNGSEATRYLDDLGVRGEEVITACLPSRTDVGLADGGHKDEPRYLFVGRLSERKHPEALLEAFAIVRRDIPGASLTIVGEGPLRSRVAELIRPHGQSARMLGKLEGSELDSVYMQSDILVLPAEREVWGLVVNEALAHGLFVVATDQVGSAHDLLDPSSGMIVPTGDRQALAAAMATAGSASREPVARRARATRVAQCTFYRFAESILAAAELAVAHPQHSQGS
jgi:glycosyltransferase involved in cell wall biosynthesis